LNEQTSRKATIANLYRRLEYFAGSSPAAK
jgi:hypothetical protein